MTDDVIHSTQYCLEYVNGPIMTNCWFSHDVTKFQTSELMILLRFYFHDE